MMDPAEKCTLKEKPMAHGYRVFFWVLKMFWNSTVMVVAPLYGHTKNHFLDTLKW